MAEEGGMARLVQRPRRRRIASAGFTLVEILVAISVIGVLLGLLLPALVAARLQGEKAVCQSRLGQIGLMTTMFAADHEGLWPVETRLLKEKKPILADSWGYVLETYTPASIVNYWAGLLRSYTSDYQGPEPIPLGPGPHTRRGDVQKAMETFACPVVYRLYYKKHSTMLRSPFWSSFLSFKYSPALYTRPSAWRLDAAPVDVYAAFAPQRVDAVTQPSGKSVLVERVSWHQRKREFMLLERPTDPPWPNASHNVLAADLHVEEKLQSQARPPVTFRGKYHFKNGLTGLLLASEHGVRGRDW